MDITAAKCKIHILQKNDIHIAEKLIIIHNAYGLDWKLLLFHAALSP